MRIGAPKEIKQDEHRVALTPAGVLELTRDGHEVIVESGAGVGSSFDDAEYVLAGARIEDAADVWESADLILKVKEPLPAEYAYLRDDLLLFTYLHLAADRPLTDALLDAGTTAIAYETIERDGALPLLAPMSEVAGRLAPQAGAFFLGAPVGGRGLLLGGVPGVAPGRVLVIGGGVVGYNAALVALGLGAQVTVLDRSIDRLRYLDAVLVGRVELVMSTTHALLEALHEADLVIGAVLVPGARAPHLVTREMLSEMKRASVLVDVAIDQGGCFATSRPTTHADPVYDVDGIVHYCVANMPGAVPITSTRALTNATLPYVRRLAAQGFERTVREDLSFERGVNAYRGKLTYAPVAQAHGLGAVPLAELIATAVGSTR